MRTTACFVALVLISEMLSAADWPTYGGDSPRNLCSADRLALPLSKAWVFKAHAPSPSFRFDRSTGYTKLETVTYDLANHPIVADNRVYVATSAEDTLCRRVSTR